MSEVVRLQADAALLEPIFHVWKEEMNGDTMGFDFSIINFTDDLNDLVRGQDSDVLLLVVEKQVVGLIALYIFDSSLLGARICKAMHLYLLPEYRKGKKNGNKLIKAAEQYATIRGCKHLGLSVSNALGSEQDRVSKLYKRLGYEELETTYIKPLEELNDGQLLQSTEDTGTANINPDRWTTGAA